MRVAPAKPRAMLRPAMAASPPSITTSCCDHCWRARGTVSITESPRSCGHPRSAHVAQDRGTRRRRRVSDGDSLAAQRHRRLDATAAAMMQLQQRLPCHYPFAEPDTGEDADTVVHGFANRVASGAEHVAGSPDGFGLQGGHVAVARCTADLAIGC